MKKMIPGLLATLLALRPGAAVHAQPGGKYAVIGYYAGPAAKLDAYPVGKLTHLIFSFGHLKGRRLHFNSAADTACIQKMVSYRQRYPHLKIILSLGGWGGCYPCSPVFDTAEARRDFAASVKQALDFFGADGIDLDWEYPAIAGHPGHPFMPADRDNFTRLVSELRKTLGAVPEISFAAGGFDAFIDSSINWKAVMPLLNRVNLMSYDLVHGFSTESGHHTPLYSTPLQSASTHRAVRRMIKMGVPAHKIVVGAAFYARLFRTTDTLNRGLYRPAAFYRGVPYKNLYDTISASRGFVQYWDDAAKAPYSFNAQRKMLATYDDARSVKLKTEYVKQHGLNGIMFWQLADDAKTGGLLDEIDKAMRLNGKKQALTE